MLHRSCSLRALIGDPVLRIRLKMPGLTVALCPSFLAACKNVLSTSIFHLRSFTFLRSKMLEYKSKVFHVSPIISDSSTSLVFELLTFPPLSATSLTSLCYHGDEHGPRRNKSQRSHSGRSFESLYTSSQQSIRESCAQVYGSLGNLIPH